MQRERVFSGAPWETKVGYCRAIKAGDHVYVTGTAPVDEKGSTFAPGDPYGQTKRCFKIIESSLARLGVSLSQVVRTRLFVTDISHWEAYGRAHHEFFKDFPPTTSMIEVKGLIEPEMLIEIEADAYIGDQ